MQAIEDDIANTEKGKAALEDKFWEVEAKLVTKLEELERHAHQFNQALKQYEHAAASPIFSKFYFSNLLEIAYRYT
jgi:kinetochore protein NDC80